MEDVALSIKDALENQNQQQIFLLLKDLHPVDIAEIIHYLSSPLRQQLVELYKDQFNPEILAELDESVREEIISYLGTTAFAAAVADLDSDDALSLIEDLDQEQQREILRAIPAEDRAILEEGFTYPEDSAGRLMQREVVCIPSFWTVKEAIHHINTSPNLPKVFYDIYVVNPKHEPIGVIPTSLILRHPQTKKISELVQETVHKIPSTMDQEKVANLFRKYSLISAPVVDTSGRVVGMITVDDIVHVIDEEAEEDILHMARVAESDLYSPILSTSYARIRWLFITLVNTLIASSVISQFQMILEKKVALAVLMPIVAAMGGNAGMQVVTITVRALASIGFFNLSRAVGKEALVALMNGLFFASILGTVAAFWFDDMHLGLVLGAAMVFNTLWAGIAGTLLPWLIHRMGHDPAISAGPLLTTTTDVLGFSTFLGLSTYFWR